MTSHSDRLRSMVIFLGIVILLSVGLIVSVGSQALAAGL